MPHPQSFHRRARAIPARFEPNISQSSDLFTPPNRQDRRHTFHAPNHEPHHQVPRPSRRRNQNHRSRSSSSDAAGIRQYQDTIHPAVIGLYKSIKASATRLQVELENLSANIDKIAPGEDHMEWKHSPGTIIYVPMAHNSPDTAGDVGIIGPNDIAPKLTVPHPHHPSVRNNMPDSRGTGEPVNPDVSYQTGVNAMPQAPPNPPAIPSTFDHLFPTTTSFPIHQHPEQPILDANQIYIPSQPRVLHTNVTTAPTDHPTVHFNSNPIAPTAGPANNPPSTLPPMLQHAIDILQTIYDSQPNPISATVPVSVPAPAPAQVQIQLPPTPAPSPSAKSGIEVQHLAGTVQDQSWCGGDDTSF